MHNYLTQRTPMTTRRQFLATSTILTLGCTLGAPRALMRLAPEASTNSTMLNAFISINPDNTVELVINHSEMGQGIYTALAQIMADELDADWDLVRVRHVPLDSAYHSTMVPMIFTGGSSSTVSEWTRLRQTGAAARQMLQQAAANAWGADISTLRSENSFVIDDVSNRKASFGELSAAAALLKIPLEPTLKDPSNFRFIGKDVARIEGPSKAMGTAKFGIDLQLDNMLIASIAHPPVFGATPISVDDSVALSMPGVHKVVTIERGVAVIANTFWQAKKAKDALNIEWDLGEFVKASTADLWQQYEALSKQRGTPVVQSGSIDSQAASHIIEAEYRFPYLAHAPMEPLNATVQLKEGRVIVWTGTQMQSLDALNLAGALRIEPSSIDIRVQWLGGGFGRRANPASDFIIEAALIAKESALDVPIKLIWQREDDIRAGYYRPMFLHKVSLGLDDAGVPLNWQHVIVGQSIAAGTILEPMMVRDGVDASSVEGIADMPYPVPNRDISLHSPTSPIPVLWFRSVGHTHSAPVVEDLINRAAEAIESDPIAYRRLLLSGAGEKAERIKGVLTTLEEKSDWKTAPPPNTVRGVAVHESFGSVCGYVVEIVSSSNSTLSFGKVTAVIDCGLAVNPENIKAQVFGSAALALSTMLGQQITIENGSAQQSNFHDYAIAKFNQVPFVDVHIVENSPMAHPTGVGEPGVPPFIPATMTAIRLATGQQISAFPFELDGYSFLEG